VHECAGGICACGKQGHRGCRDILPDLANGLQLEAMNQSRGGWRLILLAAVLILPLPYLLLIHARIPQDNGYHVFADVRTCLGINNFGNVASNMAFLMVGTWGGWWCALRMRGCARLVWGIFFASVVMVFAGSAYYHAAPDDDQLVWDRLPTTLAFTGLVGAVVT
jgi:hypothetical protein